MDTLPSALTVANMIRERSTAIRAGTGTPPAGSSEGRDSAQWQPPPQ